MIKLGERIKELRLRDGRTQEALAGKLGVTAQAISRWEKGVCYPDMELIPSIANYFGITIDELFGYQNDRAQRIDAIVKKIEGHSASLVKGDTYFVDHDMPKLAFTWLVAGIAGMYVFAWFLKK